MDSQPQGFPFGIMAVVEPQAGGQCLCGLSVLR